MAGREVGVDEADRAQIGVVGGLLGVALDVAGDRGVVAAGDPAGEDVDLDGRGPTEAPRRRVVQRRSAERSQHEPLLTERSVGRYPGSGRRRAGIR